MNQNDGTHNGTNEYVRQQCDERSDTLTTSNQKNRNVYIEIRPHICGTCGKGFKSKYSLRRHESVHKDEKPYHCDFCRQMFRRKETLRRHMVAKHSNDKRFKSNKDLYTGGVSYKCGTCNKEFKDKAQLHIHERTHNGEKPYQCEFCEDKFRIKVHLTSHMVAKHADDERFKSNKDLYTGGVSYKCGTCKKEFKNKTDFNRHERTHTGEKPYQCKLCEDEFSCKVNLEQHVVGKHWNDERYKSNKDLYIEGITHKCRTCNKEFKKKVKLHNHEKIHKGEKPLNPKCEFCEDKFRQKEGLRHHVVAKHSNDECYKSNKGLYTEDESYKCGTYNIEFKNEAQLRSHERIHKDEQPYRCEFCGQMFSGNEKLTVHKIIHANYECEKCKMCFYCEWTLQYHINLEHNDERQKFCED